MSAAESEFSLRLVKFEWASAFFSKYLSGLWSVCNLTSELNMYDES